MVEPFPSTFEAVRWELLECSLVSCPADAGASIRFHAGGFDRALVSADLSEDVRIRNLVKMRMMARQRMSDRMSRRADLQ
jgi:hypothetical protein